MASDRQQTSNDWTELTRDKVVFYEERMAALKKITPETWDTFIDDVQRLLDAIEDSNLMSIARNTINVEDSLKLIRRMK